jgi:predicted permease
MIQILTTIIAPIFVLIIAGVALERRFKLDVGTISKLTFYVFVPALLFKALTESSIDFDQLAVVAGFQVALIFVMLLLSLAVAKSMRLEGRISSAFLLAAVFCNSANYGIPLVQLAFPENPSGAVSFQAITIMIQNLSTFSLGLVIVNHGRAELSESLKHTFKFPFLYVVIAALVLKRFDVPVTEWGWFWHPIKYAGDGLVAVALLTLGIQIAKTPRVSHLRALVAANVVRLVAAPVAAWVLVELGAMIGLIEVHSMLARLLVIAAAGPSAVNTVLISLEFKSEPEFAASAVFYSTLLSAASVAITVFLVLKFM